MVEVLESVLGMKLSEKDIEKIKMGWNDFYNNPLKYKDSVVVDMVKLSLE